MGEQGASKGFVAYLFLPSPSPENQARCFELRGCGKGKWDVSTDRSWCYKKPLSLQAQEGLKRRSTYFCRIKSSYAKDAICQDANDPSPPPLLAPLRSIIKPAHETLKQHLHMFFRGWSNLSMMTSFLRVDRHEAYRMFFHAQNPPICSWCTSNVSPSCISSWGKWGFVSAIIAEERREERRGGVGDFAVLRICGFFLRGEVRTYWVRTVRRLYASAIEKETNGRKGFTLTVAKGVHKFWQSRRPLDLEEDLVVIVCHFYI